MCNCQIWDIDVTNSDLCHRLAWGLRNLQSSDYDAPHADTKHRKTVPAFCLDHTHHDASGAKVLAEAWSVWQSSHQIRAHQSASGGHRDCWFTKIWWILPPAVAISAVLWFKCSEFYDRLVDKISTTVLWFDKCVADGTNGLDLLAQQDVCRTAVRLKVRRSRRLLTSPRIVTRISSLKTFTLMSDLGAWSDLGVNWHSMWSLPTWNPWSIGLFQLAPAMHLQYPVEVRTQ